MPSDAEVSAADLAASADPSRRAILATVAEHGPSASAYLSGRMRARRRRLRLPPGGRGHLVTGLEGDLHQPEGASSQVTVVMVFVPPWSVVVVGAVFGGGRGAYRSWRIDGVGAADRRSDHERGDREHDGEDRDREAGVPSRSP